MAATRIKLASSIAYTATVGRRFVGKGAPEAGKFYSRTPIEMGEFAGQGLVKAGTRIAVGDWIWPDQRLGRQELSGEPKVVAAIDEETRSATGEWLISWAQVPPPRDGDAGPAVSLDPERFGFVLLSWVHEQSGGESAVSLSDFGSGDVPLNCVLPLAEHLGSIGLLQLQADTATIALTGQGLAAAERAAEARSSSLQRAEALQNLLVEWVHEREAVEDPSFHVDLQLFIYDPRATFNGYFFTLNDIYREVRYLQEKSIMRTTDPWWFDPWLTASGRDCATYGGGNVHEYLNPKTPQTGNTIINFGNNNQNSTGGGAQTAYAPVPTQAAPPQEAAGDPASKAATGDGEKSTTRWTKAKDFATTTGGVITFICTLVVAVFAVLTYLYMIRH